MITRIEREEDHAYSVYRIDGTGLSMSTMKSGPTVQFIVAHDDRTVVFYGETFFTKSLTPKRIGALQAAATKQMLAYDRWLAKTGKRWENTELDKRLREEGPKVAEKAATAVKKDHAARAWELITTLADARCDRDAVQCAAQNLLIEVDAMTKVETANLLDARRSSLLKARTMREYS